MKKLLLTLCALVILGINYAQADVATLTMSTGKLTGLTNSNSKTVQDDKNNDWTFSMTGTGALQNFSTDKGMQFGSSKKPISTLTVKSVSFADKVISKVTVITSCASGGNASVSVKVGNDSFLIGNDNSYALQYTGQTEASETLEFTGSASGEITVAYSVSSKAIYLMSIAVEYTNAQVDPNQPAVPTFSIDGGEVDMNTTVTITGDDKTQSLKYWFDDEEATTVTGATATVTITKACTLNAIAIGEGGVESSTHSVSFTLTPVRCDYTKVTTLTSGKYVFMCGDNFVDPVLSSNRCDFTTDFTKTGDEVEALNKYEFTITVDANNIATIQGPDGMYYGMPKATTVFASVANADNSCNWTYTVNADGQVIFTNSEYPTYTIAQHMGTKNPYNNMAPGIYKEGAVYPTLYKLVVAPAAPELDGVEITDGKITGDKLTFKVVEGVSVWYKIETETVANAPAREVNAEGYTKYEGEPITLTNNMKSVTYYSEDNATGAKSEPVTYAIDLLSGIAGIEAEAGEAVYYNLQGVRVENPVKGLYIRVANGKSQKVIM